MNETAEKKTNTKTKLWVDLLIFIVFLAAMEPFSTGIAVHEWLTIASMAAIVTHLLLNWEWIVAVTSRFFSKLATRARLNYILNLLLFIDGVLIMLTGIMISEAAVPAFGLRMPLNFAYRPLHDATANLFILLLGLHTALHWDWIVRTLKRYLGQPFARLKPARQVEQKEVQAMKIIGRIAIILLAVAIVSGATVLIVNATGAGSSPNLSGREVRFDRLAFVPGEGAEGFERGEQGVARFGLNRSLVMLIPLTIIVVVFLGIERLFEMLRKRRLTKAKAQNE